jgi:hypothetical protein
MACPFLIVKEDISRILPLVSWALACPENKSTAAHMAEDANADILKIFMVLVFELVNKIGIQM